MQRIIIILLTLLYVGSAYAHSSWKEHAKDTYEVFRFKEDAELTAWMKYISSDLIDGYNKEKIYLAGTDKVGFYDYLKFKYPGFKCKHRLLFHWGYNSRPWSNELQTKVEGYGWSESKIKQIQQDLVNEQRRRNRAANQRTEKLFGFASSGKEATMARALLSIAYDVHLLGDYEPDNKDLDGLSSLKSIVGDLINNIRELDPTGTKSLISKIQKISSGTGSDQTKAAVILRLLKSDFSIILANHPDKRIRGRIKGAIV